MSHIYIYRYIDIDIDMYVYIGIYESYEYITLSGSIYLYYLSCTVLVHKVLCFLRQNNASVCDRVGWHGQLGSNLKLRGAGQRSPSPGTPFFQGVPGVQCLILMQISHLQTV